MSFIDSLMQKDKEIRIGCEGTLFVSIDDLHELQQYKDLTNEAYERGKTSIIELGFSFPVFLWENDSKYWIIDSHQRKRILTRMRDVEGYTIPLVPAVRIFAKDRKEAKKKILAQESQYGDITQEGMYEFLNEEGFELEEAEIETFTDIPVLSFEEEKGKEEKEEKGSECTDCKRYHEQNHTVVPVVTESV